jgi:pre-mRNA-splicing factor RBM22/SLT11
VGGVTPEITEDDLRDAFYSYGELAGVRKVASRFCAFVTFRERGAAEAAAEAQHNKLTIRGVRLRLMWGRGGQGHRPPQLHDPMQPVPGGGAAGGAAAGGGSGSGSAAHLLHRRTCGRALPLHGCRGAGRAHRSQARGGAAGRGGQAAARWAWCAAWRAAAHRLWRVPAAHAAAALHAWWLRGAAAADVRAA